MVVSRARLPVCVCFTGSTPIVPLVSVRSPGASADVTVCHGARRAANTRAAGAWGAPGQQQRSVVSWLFGDNSPCRGARGGRAAPAEVRLNAETAEVDPGAVEGTSLRVVKYPHPALRAENLRIEEFGETIVQLSKEMLKVMYASRGVGLAAPQVGENVRLMVFNPEGDSKAWVQECVLVNPEIVSRGGGTDVEEEGCLSFPGMHGDVERVKWVKVSAQRLNGKKFTVKYSGWKARIFQHEYDHLDGVVYIDRLKEEERRRVQPVLDHLIGEYNGEAGSAAL